MINQTDTVSPVDAKCISESQNNFVDHFHEKRHNITIVLHFLTE